MTKNYDHMTRDELIATLHDRDEQIGVLQIDLQTLKDTLADLEVAKGSGRRDFKSKLTSSLADVRRELKNSQHKLRRTIAALNRAHELEITRAKMIQKSVANMLDLIKEAYDFGVPNYLMDVFASILNHMDSAVGEGTFEIAKTLENARVTANPHIDPDGCIVDTVEIARWNGLRLARIAVLHLAYQHSDDLRVICYQAQKAAIRWAHCEEEQWEIQHSTQLNIAQHDSVVQLEVEKEAIKHEMIEIFNRHGNTKIKDVFGTSIRTLVDRLCWGMLRELRGLTEGQFQQRYNEQTKGAQHRNRQALQDVRAYAEQAPKGLQINDE